jgi:hypothetical protein
LLESVRVVAEAEEQQTSLDNVDAVAEAHSKELISAGIEQGFNFCSSKSAAMAVADAIAGGRPARR